MRLILNDRLLSPVDQEAALRTLKDRWSTGNWRNIYKALSFFDFILKHGSEAFLSSILQDEAEWRQHLATLKSDYQATDEKGKDQGINVRVKAAAIIELLDDKTALQAARTEEREKLDRLQDRRSEFSHTISAVKQQSSAPIKETKPKDTVSDFSDEFDEFQTASPSTAEVIDSTEPIVERPKEDPFNDLLKF